MAKNDKSKGIKKRRERKNIEKGTVHIQSTFNNTIVTITDVNGNAISWVHYLPPTVISDTRMRG